MTLRQGSQCGPARLIGKNVVARWTAQDPAMWTPSESSNTTNNDRRAPQRSRHQEQRNFTTSNLVDSSRQRDFRYDREDIYSSTSASTSAAVLSPPRRSLSYEDRLSAMASASTSISASNTPIPSPSTLRTTRPLGSKRSNLTSSTPASPSVASPATSRFAQSNGDSTNLGPAATPLRSPMFSEPSSSRRPSGAATGSRRSSAARSPDSAAAALAASKYDMKRMLSKPAPTASSFGSSSAGSAGILSAASRNEDDVFGSYHQSAPQPLDSIDPLAYSSSVDTSRSHLKNANQDIWPSDSPALGAGAGGKTFPDSVAPGASTFNSTATRTRSRNASSTSSSAAQSQPSQQQQQQPSSSRTQQPHRARALTQTSSMTATTTTSSSVFPPPSSNLSHSNTSYYADYSVDSHSNSAAASSSSRSRIPPMPGVAFPISDDVGGSFLSGSGSGPGAGPAKSSASPGPTRALTPASAIAYAYQQQQQLRGGANSGAREFDSSTRPSPSPSPNPSFYTASSSSTSESGRVYGGDSEYYQHQQYLNTPFGSARTLGGGSPISPTLGRVVSNGDPESGTLGNVEKSKSSGALRTLGRKVSGKFSRKSSGGFTTSGRRGTVAAGAEDVINVSGVPSSVSTNDGSFLAMSSEFGGYEGDDSAGGGVGSARPMGFSASSSSRGGSGRSRSQYDVSQRRSPSGYFGDASGAGLADVSSSSIDASLPTSPVSPASQQQHSSTTSHQRLSKLTKTKSLLRLSQQNRSVTDPTPVPEPPTPSSTSVGTSIWKMVKKFSSSTLREKHRAGASPTEAVPPVPALPPGVVSSGSASRRSSVSDHDYGVVLGGNSAAFGGGGFGRDEGGGGRFSISSVVSRPKSEAKRSVIGRSRSGTVVSSAQSHGHGFSIQNRGAPPPDLPRSGPRSPRHEHNRSLSQSRTTTTATLSSSPISSDLSSSKYFFGRPQSSPRTSTSSYLAYSDTQDFGPPPPLPMSQKQQKTPSAPQHILPPDEIAAMLSQYGDDLGGIASAKEDDDGSSSNYHNMYSSAASRKSFASSAAPQKGSGLSAPPSRRSTSRDPPSRDPPSSRKSSTSGKGESASGHGDLQGRNPIASMSSSSLSTAPAKPAKSKKIGNFQHPPLHMMRKSGSNPATSRYVAVQGSGETSPSSNEPKTSPTKKNVLHRLMRSKSEVNLTPAPSTTNPPTPPTARPPPPRPTTAATESKERRRTSPPIPSPSSPTKRWSIDERRGSAGSGNLLNPPSAPLSPTRAASFDLQRSRPPSFSTTVMFRDLTEAPAVKRSEDEKNKMWDMLLEKSEKAGGTLHAKIDSSFY
ncbi:hypothetical protein FS837_012145 [Tulasnella sp. UAMH 9824]|nr:hypothetical protein FS837_012145 [Tulasnella sp. UAMH 9824]